MCHSKTYVRTYNNDITFTKNSFLKPQLFLHDVENFRLASLVFSNIRVKKNQFMFKVNSN